MTSKLLLIGACIVAGVLLAVQAYRGTAGPHSSLTYRPEINAVTGTMSSSEDLHEAVGPVGVAGPVLSGQDLYTFWNACIADQHCGGGIGRPDFGWDRLDWEHRQAWEYTAWRVQHEGGSVAQWLKERGGK